jgi:predicted O-linked N-acetylglucosamine transferase (SPINDLY family)
MTVLATADQRATVARTKAATALAAWHAGSVSAARVLPLLRQAARTAVDFANLGAVYRANKEIDAAEAAYRAALRLDPKQPAAHYNLGNLLLETDRLVEAEAAYGDAIEARSDYAEALNALGIVRQRRGKLVEAEAAFQEAVRYAPRWAEAQTNLGVALLGLERYDQSEHALRAAIAIDPSHAGAHGNLGAVLLRAGCPVAAEAATRAALVLAPREHRWISNLAGALQMQSRHQEAEVAYRQALELRPDYASGHGNLLFALNYREDLTPEAIFAEYRAWDLAHGRPLLPAGGPTACARLDGRRLRVGYVSADFRQHAVALFAEPLLAAHDRARVEVFCYAEIPVEDETTRRFRALADHWRPTLGMTDDEMAELVRQDGIDVLVDLGGHTAGNRLLVFARKPAPVQIEYILGHGYTSGLSAMDAFLADDWLAPAGTERLFSERLIRLPRIPLAYQPPADMPAVAPCPAQESRYVTFGYFGRPERLTAGVVAAWSLILAQVPGSQLVLNNRNFQEPAFRQMFHRRFEKHGVPSERVKLTYTAPQPSTWAAYGTIDIALDPFPHNAGTTTIEALWQGVPVVSLAGRPTVGRFGASIMHAVGLGEWVARDVDGYVARAVTAALDIDGLTALRSGLRARVAASPLLDAAGLAKQVEAIFFDLLAPANATPQTERLRQLFASGDKVAAATVAAECLVADPHDPVAAHVAGLLAYEARDLREADRLLSIAVAYAPHDVEAHANRAAVLRAMGRLAEAEEAARASLKLAPNRVETHNNLGNILRDAGRYDESVAAFQAALKTAPDFADAWANLAWVLSLMGRAQESEHAARQAIRHDPNNANGHNNLGIALMRQSRLREAEAALRQALELRPDFALPHSNILFCLNYRDDLSAEQIFSEYRAWDDRHAKPLSRSAPVFDLDRSEGRRLRVGYVSPDFRQHAAALFAEPLLAAHDPAQVELFCYAEVPVADATTHRFQALAHHWRSTVGLTDADLADMIRRDRIDVLVDMAGHTAGNRLLAFARRPAPVLIEYILGHGYTSGLSVMDAFLADDALAPAGADAFFSQDLIRLPRIPLAYRPPAGMPPVAPLPALETGAVTFGYFGRTVRLTEAVIETWARILLATPRSRLMLNSAPLAEPAGREEFARRFAAHGIGEDRLDLVCTAPQPATWTAYGRVDVALDPFPHNAGTTTIEALWQGVPVITLASRPTVGRFGVAILHSIGLDDWVTDTRDAYVARAVSAAGDLPALAALRSQLRGRFMASPLADAAGLARSVETVFRQLWDEWREGAEVRLHRLFTTGARDAARSLAQRCLRRQADHPVALHVLGVMAFEQGELTAAADLLARAAPSPDILVDRGVALRALHRLEEAEASYRQALALNPQHVHALGNLGNLLLDAKRIAEAEAMFDRALAIQPNQGWLLRGKALALMARGADGDAERVLRQALALNGGDSEIHETLAVLLGQNGRPIEAESHHRAALPGIRDRHRCLSNLAVVLQTQGRHTETESCHRGALALRPDYAPAHSNLLYSLNYRDDMSAEAIFAAYRAWDERHAGALLQSDAKFDAEPLEGRRLRVGYVSPDFRQHAAALFSEPLIAAHDRTRFEIFCYAEVAVEDAVPRRFRDMSDHWRSTVGKSDDDVVAQIRHDRIDVLIDMAGHTAGSRLLVFARRSAPVQIEYILGHGYTSGMRAMDVFVADDTIAPPSADSLFTETILRLPRIPLAYRPPSDMPPVTPLPASKDGRITFGHFGRPERLTESTINAWSRILLAVPSARLILNSRPFFEPAFRDLFANRFAAHGIARDRLELIYTHPQPRTWDHYGQVDIGLDPFPHNAGTTTIEALWQGVPVLTLAGRPSVGRIGASILQTVGLHDWVTTDPQTYIARAVAAAEDLATLAKLRQTLRARVASSKLCDAADLAHQMEVAYVALWQAWRTQAAIPLAAD